MEAVRLFFLILLLFLLKVHVSLTDGMMGESALQKSEHCVQAARQAYEILSNKPDAAATAKVVYHLETLAEDGKYLKRSAQHYLNKLETQEEELGRALGQLQNEKGELEKEMANVMQSKENAEKEFSAKQAVLRGAQNQLVISQTEVKNAKNELNSAENRLKNKKRGLLGKIKSVLGMLDGLKNRVNGAKNAFQRRQSELNAAQNAANAARQALSSVEHNVNQRKSKIQQIQQMVDVKHREISSIKSSIVLLRDSTDFWELFVVAAESAEHRTKSLKRIVDIVALVKDYEIFKEDGTVTKAKSFLEAWGVFTTLHQIEEE